MATGNRAVVFHGTEDMRVDTVDYPKLEMPNGQKAPHGVILKLVATNICGSDLHIYRGSFPVPQGMVMGHEMTGEVVEIGSDVEEVVLDAQEDGAQGVGKVRGAG